MHKLVGSKKDLLLSTAKHHNTAQKFWYLMRHDLFLLPMLLLQLLRAVLHAVVKKGIGGCFLFSPIDSSLGPTYRCSFWYKTRSHTSSSRAQPMTSFNFHSKVVVLHNQCDLSSIPGKGGSMPRWGKNEGQVQSFCSMYRSNDQREILSLPSENTQFTDLARCNKNSFTYSGILGSRFESCSSEIKRNIIRPEV